MRQPYAIDLQSLKPKRLGVKLKDLQKQALYVRSMVSITRATSSPKYCFQAIQSPRNHCAKNLPQFAGKANVRAIAAQLSVAQLRY